MIVLCQIVADVVQRIADCPNLKYLELEGNTLGVSASKAIGKALESKRELEAALWKDLFTGRLKNEIPQAFVSKFPSILYIIKIEFGICKDFFVL